MREEPAVGDKQIKRLGDFIAPLRVPPGKGVVLERDYDPRYKDDMVRKSDGKGLLDQGVEVLTEYQERLAAQDTFGLLVCLQAMDAAGKDGTIRHVMSGVNPQGVHVHSFKVPSDEELDHDFLWRYNQHLPARGDIAVFNRSHYEEVLVVRVHPELLERQKLPAKARGKDVWKRRYHEINEWEKHLVHNGFPVVKIFLNLSKEEQRIRFLRRLDLPDHNWKFSSNDVKERAYWDDYQKAFSEMLSHTSTEHAPWYVVPADRKWFARICVSAILAHTLSGIDPKFPRVDEAKKQDLIAARELLEAEAPKGAEPDPFEAELERRHQTDH
jgi:PPK2 family polyphosphate:nucleotide phosphotransferase